jgi:hypothetical protein
VALGREEGLAPVASSDSLYTVIPGHRAAVNPESSAALPQSKQGLDSGSVLRTAAE